QPRVRPGLRRCGVPHCRTIARLCLRPGHPRTTIAFASMAHFPAGLSQLPSASSVRSRRLPRPRRLPMAHPLSQTVLECATPHLARPVGTEWMAELCDYRGAAGGDVMDCAEVWEFSPRAGIRIRKSSIHANAAAKISFENKPCDS